MPVSGNKARSGMSGGGRERLAPPLSGTRQVESSRRVQMTAGGSSGQTWHAGAGDTPRQAQDHSNDNACALMIPQRPGQPCFRETSGSDCSPRSQVL